MLELERSCSLSLLILESRAVKPVELLACFLFTRMHLCIIDFFNYRLSVHLLVRFMDNV